MGSIRRTIESVAVGSAAVLIFFGVMAVAGTLLFAGLRVIDSVLIWLGA